MLIIIDLVDLNGTLWNCLNMADGGLRFRQERRKSLVNVKVARLFVFQEANLLA
jgi:hypothetical protein